jgi:TPR repeat protein
MTRWKAVLLILLAGVGMLLVGVPAGMRWSATRNARRDMDSCERLKDRAACDRACAQDFAVGCYLAAEMQKDDRDKRIDAQLLYEKGCVGGDPRACRALGFWYRDGATKSASRALERFERGCKGNDATACYESGSMYLSGSGVKSDEVHAAAMFEMSCAGGHPHGCTMAAYQFTNGQRVPHDSSRARALLERGCTLHDAAGCAQLGRLYESGWGQYPPRDQDREKARHFYKVACQEGDRLSCENVDALACEDAGGLSLAHSPVIQHFVISAGINVCHACRILRMEMDVTGDDQPELFLTGSCLAGNAGATWHVYTPTRQRTYRCLGEVFFHFKGFRYDRSQSLLIAYHRLGGGEGGFEYSHLGADGVRGLRQSDVVSTESPEFHEEWERMQRWRSSGPVVTGADLKELSTNPETVWVVQESEGKPYPQHAPLSVGVADVLCPEAHQPVPPNGTGQRR